MSPKAARILGEETSVPKPRVARKEWASASGNVIQARKAPANLKLGQVRKRKSKRMSKKPAPFNVGDRVWARWEEDELFYRAEIVFYDQLQDKAYTCVFSDYGNMQVCKLDQLRPLNDPVMLGIAGIELSAAKRNVDRSARPISVAITKETLAEAQREDEEKTRRENEIMWSKLQAKTVAKKRAETESKAIAEAIALATELTLKQQKEEIDLKSEPPPRYSIIEKEKLAIAKDEIHLAQTEKSKSADYSDSLNATLLQREVMALAEEIGELGGDDYDFKMESLSRDIELAETIGDSNAIEELREELELVRNEILELRIPAKALPMEPVDEDEDKDEDEELLNETKKKGLLPESESEESDLEESSSREVEDSETGESEEENDDEWTAEDYYEERQYAECLKVVEIEMREKRAEGVLDESYIELVLLKSKCLMRLKDEKSLEKSLETLEYAQSLAEGKCGVQ